jgi:hypothetical protein
MSKQSDAKIKQGWSKEPRCCETCLDCDKTSSPRAAYPGDDGVHVTRKCGPGGFAVKPRNSCNLWKP